MLYFIQSRKHNCYKMYQFPCSTINHCDKWFKCKCNPLITGFMRILTLIMVIVLFLVCIPVNDVRIILTRRLISPWLNSCLPIHDEWCRRGMMGWLVVAVESNIARLWSVNPINVRPIWSTTDKSCVRSCDQSRRCDVRTKVINGLLQAHWPSVTALSYQVWPKEISSTCTFLRDAAQWRNIET